MIKKLNSTKDQDIIGSVQQILHSESLKEIDILTLLPFAVYITDSAGVIIKYNPKAVEIWGKVPGVGEKDELLYNSFSSYHPNGVSDEQEMIVRRADKTEIHVRANITPIKDEQGDIIGRINSLQELRPKQKLQKELNWKTKQLQDYVENAVIGLHWVDQNGIIKWANKAELDMLGYTEEEYIGHHISEFHADRDVINDILKRLSCNEALKGYESTLRCKDGSLKHVHISSNVFWDENKFVHTRCFTIDVTEEKKLFNALKESESKYRQLLHSLHTAIYTTDAAGKITFYNKAAIELWGREPQVGKDCWCGSMRAFTLDGREVALENAPMAVCLREEKPVHGQELIIERPDGSRRFIVPYPTPLHDAHGKLSGAINVIVDITDRKNIEKAYNTSEHQYKQLIQSLGAAVYTTDKDGKITLFNRAAAELWGREPEIGKDLWCGSFKIFKTDGSELPLDSCPMAVCLKEQRPVFGEEILVARPDGSMRYVAPHPQPLFDDNGNMIGAINMLVDISNVKRTENALRESEAKYRELASSLERKVEEKTADLKLRNEELKRSEERYHKMVEEVEDYAIILLDKNGIIQNWNKGAEKIKGYKEGEIVGKSFSNFYLPEDRNSGLPQMLLRQASQKGKAIHEGWRMRKDGTVFWGSIVLTALHDDENNILGFSKVTRDLTERKLSEDRLREYTSQLEFQNKELEQFAYAASHDMKEPLRKIHFYNSSIAENPANILDEKSREFLNRSLNSVKRITDLIEDLLTYSKTTANIESFDEVDLTAVLEEIKLIHKEEFEQKEVELETDELPKVFAVPFQMKQLLYNLINNSIKYQHPDRKVKIQLRTDIVKGSEIKDRDADASRNYHRISIIDNGIGFEAEHAEKIFNVFQRLNNVPATRGSGIGLAICKRIIQNHHGFIKAFGKQGHGARFDIFLPKEL